MNLDMAVTAMRSARDGLAVYPTGDRWIVTFDGQRVELDDDAATRALAMLIGLPGCEISALALERTIVQPHNGWPLRRIEFHDARERARLVVSGVIEEALAAIAAKHPGLARHLRASIRIGVVCRYDPVP